RISIGPIVLKESRSIRNYLAPLRGGFYSDRPPRVLREGNKMHARKSWWVPVSSLALAVVLAQEAAPSLRGPARRATDPTGCPHAQCQMPGDDIQITSLDGVTTISKPAFKDFNINQAWNYNKTLRNIVKSQDGSVTLNAHVDSDTAVAPSLLVQINEK